MLLLEVKSLEMLDVGEPDSVEVEGELLVPIFSHVVHGIRGTGQVPGGIQVPWDHMG